MKVGVWPALEQSAMLNYKIKKNWNIFYFGCFEGAKGVAAITKCIKNDFIIITL